MSEALYGPDGFFLRSAPRGHFRTSVTASPVFAAAVRRLAGLVDDALGRPDPFDLVDLGAGRGELLQALRDVPARWRLTGVDVVPDHGGPFSWATDVPAVQGLLLANEWLDNVPLEVLFDERVVEVAADGAERLGAPASAESLAWAAQWWPQGRRVEVGLSRDRAWTAAVGRVSRGLAVAVDYGHVLGDRTYTFGDRRPTLTGYRDGHQVQPVPDGSTDITAHVALDSCAAATGAVVLTQREALQRLGIDAVRPSRSQAADDPRGYLDALAAATHAGELLDPRGLGSFGWVVQPVGIEDPLSLTALLG